MAVTTPDAVPGEVIEAAWGDAVRADLNAHETAIADTATARRRHDDRNNRRRFRRAHR